MGVSQSDGGRMEGWLYLIRSNRIGLQYSRKRYFVLQDHLLKSFKSVPLSPHEDPVRSAIIDSCIRVTDNGRESIHRKVIFIFTLYNTSNHNDQLKLGANSPEEAAKWIQSFQESALKPNQNQGDFEFATREPESLRGMKRRDLLLRRYWRREDDGTYVQKKGYVDLHEMAREDSLSCKYGCTLPKDPTCNLLCSWTETDPSTFLIRGKTYLDDRKKLGIDIGSSTVARGVVSLVLGYLNNLVIEMAFLVQGLAMQANTPEELPEYLIGTCRLNHLDVSKSVLVKP
ncbi:UNVERIFIED_CONTAM: Protein ENHANCED DISEASE RESISTANCE 2-like protein [Sesamum indicum]